MCIRDSFIGTTISGMTGRGSIRHNNRSFSAANVDRSRSAQNVTSVSYTPLDVYKRQEQVGAECHLLLCRILPRPVIPEMVVPMKSPVPFLQKAHILLFLFYHNWPQATTSLLLSCEKVTPVSYTHLDVYKRQK